MQGAGNRLPRMAFRARRPALTALLRIRLSAQEQHLLERMAIER